VLDEPEPSAALYRDAVLTVSHLCDVIAAGAPSGVCQLAGCHYNGCATVT